LNRGEIVKVIVPGDYGKARPAIVIQSQLLSEIPSIVIVPCTSELIDDCFYRPDIPADAQTGLRLPTQAMADKVTTVSKHRVRETIGVAPAETLEAVMRSVQFVIGSYD
jgi:mRNA interferase MazF